MESPLEAWILEINCSECSDGDKLGEGVAAEVVEGSEAELGKLKELKKALVNKERKEEQEM